MSGLDRDEPAVRSPELAAFVDLARRQRPTASALRVDDLVRAARGRRAARSRRTIAVVMAAAAAIAVVWFGASKIAALGVDERTRDEAVFDRASASAGGSFESSDAHGRDDSDAREPTPPAAPASPRIEPAPVEPAPVEPAPVEPGPAPSSKPTRPSADLLAKAAERAMAERRTKDAIGLLEQIVRGHAEHPATKTALLDLGRLRRASGQDDHARCAYRTFRKRWPSDPMTGEVDKALAALGDGAGCRGLRPSR